MSILDSANFFVSRRRSPNYRIQRSVRFNPPDSANFTRVAGATYASSRILNTTSLWVKRSLIGSGGTTYSFWSAGSGASTNSVLYFNASDQLSIAHNPGGGTTIYRASTQQFRDYTAWYHIVMVVDTANATVQNRLRLYVNGSEITAWATNTAAALNLQFFWGESAATHAIGSNFGSVASQYFAGYIADVRFVAGQALTPSSFGYTDQTTGAWTPKKCTASFSAGSFWLDFSDNSSALSSTLGKDRTFNNLNLPNDFNFTPNNISVAAGAGNDSMRDTPTPYAGGHSTTGGNYCTWFPQAGGQTWTFTNGALDAINGNTGVAGYSCIGTIAVSSGKWYWEITCNDAGNTALRVPGVGIMDPERNVLNSTATVRPDVYLSGNGTIDNSAGTALQSGFANMAAGDIVGVNLDADNKTVTFYRNNQQIGSTQSYSPRWVTPSFYSYNTYDCNANFGQRPFVYAPMNNNFRPLCSENINPSIVKPNDYLSNLLYTGLGSGNSFAFDARPSGSTPGLVWIKSRSAATAHSITDIVRGDYTDFEINTAAEVYYGTFPNQTVDLYTGGYTVGSLAKVNTLNATYVSWVWHASATTGFEMINYLGNGSNGAYLHNLGRAPSMLLIKNRSTAARNWAVWHRSMSAANYLLLNTTAAQAAGTTYWNSTAPDSNTFTVGTNQDVNSSFDSYVAYIFAEIPGFSRFGSYVGNGVADGPYVPCGFRPQWVMAKSLTSVTNWVIIDSLRNTTNPVSNELVANTANGENGIAITTTVDFLANGFKIRTTDANWNSSAQTYVFAAFAEFPFKYARAR